MARRTIQALIDQAAATINDNSTGDISPADIRTLISDFLDTIAPAYGGIKLDGPTTQTLATTPTPLVMGAALPNTSPEWTITPASASMARTVPPSAGSMTNQFWINGAVSGANNSDLTVMLYRNNAPTGWQALVTLRGAGVSCDFVLNAIDAMVNADATYQLYVKVSSAGACVFSNVQFAGTNIPVRVAP